MFSPRKPSRLGQWTGRRRSSRSEEPVLPRLWRRVVLLRLAAVLVTVVGAAALGYSFGPAQSFRTGEVFVYEIRSRVDFTVVNQALTDRKREEAVEGLPGERHGDSDCQAARNAVEPAFDVYR